MRLTQIDMVMFCIVFAVHVYAGGKAFKHSKFALVLTVFPSFPLMYLVVSSVIELVQVDLLWTLQVGTLVPCGVLKASEYSLNFLPPCAIAVFNPLYNVVAFVLIVLLCRRGTKAALIGSQLICGWHLLFKMFVEVVLTHIAHAGYLPY